MTTSRFYIFSLYEDKTYVQHLLSLLASFPDAKILFSIGNRMNCKRSDILTNDNEHLTSVLKLSYETVPNYKRIENTFYWLRPNYSYIKFDNKVIVAQSSILDEQLNLFMGYLLIPDFSENLNNANEVQQVKNHAICSNRACIFLK